MNAAARAISRRGAGALLASAALLGVSAAPQAFGATSAPVRVTTGKATHIIGSTAQLNGSVVAPGITTSVFFKYGPTVAYGHVTKALTVAPPPVGDTKAIRVGEPATGLLANWHYTICASFTNPSNAAAETVCDTKDTVFKGSKKASKLKFVLPKGKEDRISVVYGGTLELAGTLSGANNGLRGLALQATPFPFTDPFAAVGGTVVTGRTGAFIFRVARMLQNTEFRILTTDTKPVYSPTVTVHVTPRITLHVRSAGKTGLYRFYGTVAPSRPGSQVTIQQLVPQKAQSKREGPAAHAVGSTKLKKATKSLSRFSVIVSLSDTFHYRAFVKLASKGAIESGHSANVLIKAPKGTTKHKRS